MAHDNIYHLSLDIEALLHASDCPLDVKLLQLYTKQDKAKILLALGVLKARCQNGVLELVEVATGFRLQIAQKFTPLIQNAFGKDEKLSTALLETLSIIAYKQPVTRGDIEHIRGVSASSSVLRQLFDKGWIKQKGYKDILGRPALLHTTDLFLEHFGLKSLQDLPPLPQPPNSAL